jgi:small GTP-binding protein
MSKIYMVKVGIVGNYNVGKTSFLNTYIEQESISSQLSTIGVDFRHKIYNYDNKDFKLHIWDTAGQEQYANIVRSYLREVDVIILMYDITNKKSFDNLDKWLNEVEYQNKNKKIIKYIVGNKKDMEKKREIDFKILKTFCKNQDIQYSETSIKDIDSINVVFTKIVVKINESLNKNEITLKTYHKFEPEEKKDIKEKSKCCTIL